MDTSRSGFQKDFWLAAGDSIPVRESAIQEQQCDLPCARINRSLGCDLLMSPRPGTYDFLSDNMHGNRWLQLELKATESASLSYTAGNLTGYIGVRNAATFVIWSLVDSKKKAKQVALPDSIRTNHGQTIVCVYFVDLYTSQEVGMGEI